MPNLVNLVGSSTIVVFAAIVIVVLLVAYLTSRYKVAGANEALIRSGRATPLGGGEAGLMVVRGQGVVVLPLFHKIGCLKLTARQINVSLADAVSRQGIKVAVQGVATFKIGADEESIRNAAERFLESREEDVDSIVKNVLEGSLRSIVGTLTIEELNLDRQKFQQAVQDAAKGDLATSGLQIDSFTIQVIRDESGYMDLIGQQETARRERDARMAKAAADQEAAVREAEANQVKINAERDVAVRRAQTQMEIAAAEAKAAQAGPLAQAQAQQEVVRKQTELAQLEADRTQKELVASTIRPAEAEAEAQIRRAEGEKGARIAQAQADAERVKLAGQAEAAITVVRGEAQARVIEVNAEAEAKKTTVEGNAEAGIVFTKGEAEAKALSLRAEAYRQFNDAAIIQTVLSLLPEIVSAAAEPMGNIGSLTVVSADGASDVVKTTTRTVAEAGAVVKGLTGIDLPNLINGAVGTLGVGGTEARGNGHGDGNGHRQAAGAGTRTRAARTRAEAATRPADAGSAAAAARGATPAAGGPEATTAAAGTAPGRADEAAPGAGVTAPAPATATGAASAGLAEPPMAPPVPDYRAEAVAAARPAAATQPAGAPAAQPATRPAAARAPAVPAIPKLPSSPITADMTVDAAAARLAAELRDVPGIERYTALRLDTLQTSGPRPLRAAWRLARHQLDVRYGQMTIGELLERFRAPGSRR